MASIQILHWTFKLLTVCGCWLPHSWSSPYKKTTYNIYTLLVIFLIHSFTLSQFLDIILTVQNADDFTDSIYMLLAMLISCCKMYSLLLNDKNIISLINILEGDLCTPTNVEERKIYAKFDHTTRSNTIVYCTMIETTVACIVVTSLFRDFGNRRLAYRAWLPYDYSSLPLFCMTYTHQMLALTIGSLLHVASDSLICGLILYTCSQIEILEYRLNVIANDGIGSLEKCIYHHNQIYWLARKINDDFRIMLFTQFLVSTLIICFNLYQLTKITPYESRFLEISLYMVCMMIQIFFYCWYGNKLKVMSLRIPATIFEMNWPTLSNRSKMVLLMIMRRATVPIEFTSGHVVALNLNSFVALLKTSYSAYNLLQQTKVP